jgi:membrane protein
MADMPPKDSWLTTRSPVDRERVVRTLTFWLRPAFVLRVLNRFQVIAGFDRAMALASSTLTALIDVGLFGVLLLVIAILSFARGVQRLFERTWELRPLSVRNTVNDLLWIAGLIA